MTEFIQTTFSTFYALIPVTIAQSLIMGFVVLGIMLPFRVLNFPDMTAEGAFPLGGCVATVLIVSGVNPWLAVAVAILAGFIAGCCTAYIHLRFRIHTLLAGILMTTMLYSINLRIMGRSNISLFGSDSILDVIPVADAGSPWNKIAIVGVLLAIAFFVMNYFFKTEKGTAMRAVGANPDMSEAQGINVWTATIIGIGIAGGFSAMAGALMVQSQGFGDINMGLGVLINGLAALMIGEAIIGNQTVFRQLLAPIVGALIYYQLISLCLAANMPPPDLKLATGLFVLFMLGLPSLRGGRKSGSAPGREAMRERPAA
ncbi:ABC transporter permease [Diaphorobacter caeni]|uniref:ABC transporter permease n=1 Tax=Diaphorobacter caeni TaxID=2784387 RepID=UPI00188FF2B8|nr:ABC transporter permease [Diaphorobacter caeni]MBF5006772.1 ABC transporter permease [Diaphorobacter caeni]